MKSHRQGYFNKFLYHANLSHFLFHFIRPFSKMTFGQKIIHKAKFDNRSLLTIFADKVAIKVQVAEIIGSEYVIPTYKVLDNALDLNFNEYSREFVLKPSHASGAGFIIHEGAKRSKVPLNHNGSTWIPYYEIHPDDLKINEDFIHEKSDGWLKSTYAPKKEYCYAGIPPKLIVEKYMRPDPTALLTDFRLYTFHGEVKFFRATTGVANHIPAFAYDKFGQPLNIRAEHDDHDFKGPHPALPSHYTEMIKLAEILAEGVDFVRVDLYLIGKQIYFSELTNFPLGGFIAFIPDTFNKQVGSDFKAFDVCSFNKK